VWVSELSREVEMALTLKWLAVVGDEFDIVVSVWCLYHSLSDLQDVVNCLDFLKLTCN